MTTSNILALTRLAVGGSSIYARSLETERSVTIILDMIRTGALVVMQANAQTFVIPPDQLLLVRERYSDAVPLVNTEPAESTLREHVRQAMAVWN